MKSKLIKIKGCKTCTEVLLYLDRNDSEDFVRIIAWHNSKEGELIQVGEIKAFESDNDALICKNIISDFSEFSANCFANSFKC